MTLLMSEGGMCQQDGLYGYHQFGVDRVSLNSYTAFARHVRIGRHLVPVQVQKTISVGQAWLANVGRKGAAGLPRS